MGIRAASGVAETEMRMGWSINSYPRFRFHHPRGRPHPHPPHRGNLDSVHEYPMTSPTSLTTSVWKKFRKLSDQVCINNLLICFVFSDAGRQAGRWGHGILMPTIKITPMRRMGMRVASGVAETEMRTGKTTPRVASTPAASDLLSAIVICPPSKHQERFYGFC